MRIIRKLEVFTLAYKTEQRSKLLNVMQSEPHRYFTAKELADILDHHNISLSAVYRNLSTMSQEGIVKKTIGKNGREAVYRYINSDECKNEIHIRCLECGKIFHLDHAVSESFRNKLMEMYSFAIDSSKTVIMGLCENCRKANTN